jgi:hypothetical protein
MSGLTHGLHISVIATQGSNLKVLFSGNECVSPKCIKFFYYTASESLKTLKKIGGVIEHRPPFITFNENFDTKALRLICTANNDEMT